MLVELAVVACCLAVPALHRLSPLYPDTLMLGMEIRDKVTEYVRERIGKHKALRSALALIPVIPHHVFQKDPPCSFRVFFFNGCALRVGQGHNRISPKQYHS